MEQASDPAPEPHLEEAQRRLRRFLREHNRAAISAVILSLFLALLLWGAYYGGGLFLSILFSSVSRSLDHLPPDVVNDMTHLHWLYPRVFFSAGLAACAAAVAFSRSNRLEAWRQELPFLVRGALDLLIFPATLLIDALATVRAFAFLSRRDRALGCAVLARLHAGHGRLGIQSIAQESSDPRAVLRVLLALHLAQAVETRGPAGQMYLTWMSDDVGEALGFPVFARGPAVDVAPDFEVDPTEITRPRLKSNADVERLGEDLRS